MEVICRWISEEQKGKTFYGLEQETILSENWKHRQDLRRKEEMSPGILDDVQEPQEFIFYNSRIRSSGGGGNHTVPKKSYISFKKTDERKIHFLVQYLHFYNQSGQVMEIAESGENGYFKIENPPDGTYAFPQGDRSARRL